MKKILGHKITKKAIKWISIAIAGIITLFGGVFIALQLNLTRVEGEIDPNSKLYNKIHSVFARQQQVEKTPDWATTPDWKLVRSGLTSDKSTIQKVSRITGVPVRTILAPIVVEQFRYYGSNREVFKKLFMPLSKLGNSVKFSYGIAGVKTATAFQIEQNLKDPSSPYYLGSKYEHILDFKTKDHDKERLSRLTDDNNHYYSYLYTALYIKQIEKQWERAGYPINNRPEVLATLFNLGYDHSEPKANPEIGGSTIKVNGEDYTFGGLAYEFYYSKELLKTFPIY